MNSMKKKKEEVKAINFLMRNLKNTDTTHTHKFNVRKGNLNQANQQS